MLATIEGRGVPPALVLLYVQGLPDHCLTHALMRGGREHYGWGDDRHLSASIFDALQFNTEASGRWGKKPPSLARWPRPTDTQKADEQPKKGRSVADLFRLLGGKGTTE